MDPQPVSPYTAVLNQAHTAALDYLDSINDRPDGADCGVHRSVDAVLAGPLPESGADPTVVIEDLARCARRGVLASGGARVPGPVVGGTLPPAVAADWMVSAWDRCAALFDTSPMTAVLERAALDWTIDLLGLGGAGVSGGFTPGTTEAHALAFSTASAYLLAARGWDVAGYGLCGAPPFPVIVSADAHESVRRALRQVGIGRKRVITVPTDDQGRMRLDVLDRVLARAAAPGLVVVSAGEINTGSFDPIGEIVARTRPQGHWCHVDGAFGLWAGACPALRHLTVGVGQADSWATDFQPVMQSSYDGGVVLWARPEADRAAMTTGTRAVPVWAVLRSLGRDGVADLVSCCHANAAHLAELVSASALLRVANDVVLNQVLLDVAPQHLGDSAAEAFVAAVVDMVRADGTRGVGGTRWRGRPMLRVSMASWQTTREQVATSAMAILRAVRHTRERAGTHRVRWRTRQARVGTAERSLPCRR